MSEAKFSDVTLFLLNVVCPYPLQTSRKTLSVSNLLRGYRNIRLGLTDFIAFKLVLPSIATDLYGNSNWPVRRIGRLASIYSDYGPYKLM